jgi:hypothetical protein
MIFKFGVSLSRHKHPFLIAFTYFVLLISYRTLSIHVEQGQRQKSKTDPATAIRQIDVHTLPVDDVYTRFSTSPTLGLVIKCETRFACVHHSTYSSSHSPRHRSSIYVVCIILEGGEEGVRPSFSEERTETGEVAVSITRPPLPLRSIELSSGTGQTEFYALTSGSNII